MYNSLFVKARKLKTNKIMDNENKSIQIHELEMPFVAVEKDGIFKIAAGDTIISKNDFTTLDEAKAYVNSKPYELIINISCYCMEQTLKQNEKENQRTTEK